MKRGTWLILLIALLVMSQGAERGEPHQEAIDWEANGFQKMYATAYYTGHHTANGSAVHTGGCACNPHVGDVAIVYTLDGNFLGYYECNDKGGTEGLYAGTVIDIYRNNLTQCQMFMKITGGKVYVKWIEGDG